MNYVLVLIGGGLGAVCRYWMQGAVQQSVNSLFPYGTFVVNILGCFLIGFVMQLAETKLVISPDIRIFITTGFLGGFTTFSAFGYESFSLIRSGDFWHLGINVTASVFAGLAAVWFGHLIAKWI